jgi:hypothetical protein
MLNLLSQLKKRIITRQIPKDSPIPVEHIPNAIPTASTCAVILQNFDPELIRDFPGNKVFVGPFDLHIFAKYVNETGWAPYSGIHLLPEIPYNRDRLIKEFSILNSSHANWHIFSVGVDTNHFKPTKSINERDMPLVYLKTYDGYQIPENKIFQLLTTANQFNYIVLRTSRDESR